MVHHPSTAQNPSDAALSAIEEALGAEEDLFGKDGARPSSLTANHRPANDDARSFSHIIHGMQRKASSAPLIAASIVSVVWAGASLFYTRRLIGELDLSAPGGMAQLLLLGIVIAAPVLFFFTLAALTRRVQEMRIVSRSMAQVAMRLSEPDKSSQASVSSLSEAVRREISAMDSSIERVLTRAGELEATVRGEVV